MTTSPGHEYRNAPQMQRFRNILVGVDLSHADRLAASELDPPTREAVRRGQWLAERLKARLTFQAVLEISPQAERLLQENLGASIEPVTVAARVVLDALVQHAAEAGVAAEGEVVIGRAWQELIRRVQRAGHDVVIVGTRESSLLGKAVFGSTALKLLRYCPCPVWIARPDSDWSDLNILVATDLDEMGQAALHMAVNGGQLAQGRLHVLHALDLGMDRHFLRPDADEELLQKFRSERRLEAERRIHEQLSQTDYRTLPHGVQIHVIEGPPATVILEAIERLGIDLLVMGTAARSGISGWFIGNTAERVMPSVPCSLLAIKPADFQCPTL